MIVVDVVVQLKLFGVENVIIVYCCDCVFMLVSCYEQDLVVLKGVKILFNVMFKVVGFDSIMFEYINVENGCVVGIGEEVLLLVDQVFKVIGQILIIDVGFDLDGGKIKVLDIGCILVFGVWVGGDCVSGGDDLIVIVVVEGCDVVEDIYSYFLE